MGEPELEDEAVEPEVVASDAAKGWADAAYSWAMVAQAVGEAGGKPEDDIRRNAWAMVRRMIQRAGLE